MTITTLKDDAVTGADRRHAVVTGLADLAAWLEVHRPDWEPTPVFNVPLPAGTREEKLAALEAFAAEWGTEVTAGPLGMRIAVRKFGPVSVEAHVSHPDPTVKGYLGLVRDAQAGSGEAA